MRRWFLPVVGVISLAVSGCSGNDVIVRKQVEMEGNIERLSQTDATLTARIGKFGDALAELQRQMQASAVDPQMVSQLKAQVDELNLKLADLKQSLAQVQQTQNQQAAAVHLASSHRSAVLATPPPVPRSDSPAPQVQHEPAPVPVVAAESKKASVAKAAPVRTVPVKAATRGASAKGSGKEAYAKAFALFTAGKYSRAAEAFEAFVKGDPSNRLAPNAYYWIGECHYSQKRYAQALQAFNTVASDYSKSEKVPDALLKAGLTQILMKEPDKGKETLRSLVERYPKSPAAAKAKEKASL